MEARQTSTANTARDSTTQNAQHADHAHADTHTNTDDDHRRNQLAIVPSIPSTVDSAPCHSSPACDSAATRLASDTTLMQLQAAVGVQTQRLMQQQEQLNHNSHLLQQQQMEFQRGCDLLTQVRRCEPAIERLSLHFIDHTSPNSPSGGWCEILLPLHQINEQFFIYGLKVNEALVIKPSMKSAVIGQAKPITLTILCERNDSNTTSASTSATTAAIGKMTSTVPSGPSTTPTVISSNSSVTSNATNPPTLQPIQQSASRGTTPNSFMPLVRTASNTAPSLHPQLHPHATPTSHSADAQSSMYSMNSTSSHGMHPMHGGGSVPSNHMYMQQQHQPPPSPQGGYPSSHGYSMHHQHHHATGNYSQTGPPAPMHQIALQQMYPLPTASTQYRQQSYSPSYSEYGHSVPVPSHLQPHASYGGYAPSSSGLLPHAHSGHPLLSHSPNSLLPSSMYPHRSLSHPSSHMSMAPLLSSHHMLSPFTPSPPPGRPSDSPTESINSMDDQSHDKSKSHKGTSCHQCKNTKPLKKLAFCSNQFNKRTKPEMRSCRKKYCDSCLRKFYSELLPELPNTGWICASCQRRCVCAACVRHVQNHRKKKLRVGVATTGDSTNNTSSHAPSPAHSTSADEEGEGSERDGRDDEDEEDDEDLSDGDGDEPLEVSGTAIGLVAAAAAEMMQDVEHSTAGMQVIQLITPGSTSHTLVESPALDVLSASALVSGTSNSIATNMGEVSATRPPLAVSHAQRRNTAVTRRAPLTPDASAGSAGLSPLNFRRQGAAAAAALMHTASSDTPAYSEPTFSAAELSDGTSSSYTISPGIALRSLSLHSQSSGASTPTSNVVSNDSASPNSSPSVRSRVLSTFAKAPSPSLSRRVLDTHRNHPYSPLASLRMLPLTPSPSSAKSSDDIDLAGRESVLHMQARSAQMQSRTLPRPNTVSVTQDESFNLHLLAASARRQANLLGHAA